MLKLLAKSARFASFEITSESPYREEVPYKVYLNGELVSEDARNIQTLYGLSPNTEYVLEVQGVGESLHFTTESEDFTLNVRDFGAIGDGQTDDTQAIQAALYTCPPDSRVLIPAGTYRFTSLYFKSNTRVELAKGATLLAIESRQERAILPGMIRNYRGGKYYLGSWEGNPLDSFAGLLNLIDVENVVLYGEGVLEANGSKEGFWHNPKVKNLAWRPRSVFMRRVKQVSLIGITIKNSPAWTVHPMESQNLKFINTSIQNPWDSPNTDGINPESCDGVEILGCHFSLGDDCIAIKSGKIYMARALGIPSQNIKIRNCFMEHGHGGVTIGSEMASGVRNVLVENCLFQDTDRGLRIKTRRGRGNLAVVDAIHFENVHMDKVMSPFVLNMFYFCDPDGHSDYVQNKEDIGAKVEDLPALKNFVFRNIRVKNASLGGFFAYGLPEQPIESVLLENITLEMLPVEQRLEGIPAMMDGEEWQKSQVIFAKNIEKLVMRNIEISGQEDDKIFLENVKEEVQEAVQLSTKS